MKLARTQQPDPTRVETAETRQEREEDIRKLEAGEKLEDVKDVQETIEKVNDALLNAPGNTGTPAVDGKPVADVVTSGDLLLTLAAGAEMAEIQDEAESAAASNSAAGKADAAGPEAGSTETSDEAKDEAEAAVTLARAGPGDAGTPGGEDGQASGILPVSLDENGIYEILKRQAEATQAA